MTENSDPCENAIAGRVNGILKDEYELNNTFPNYHTALEAAKVLFTNTTTNIRTAALILCFRLMPNGNPGHRKNTGKAGI